MDKDTTSNTDDEITDLSNEATYNQLGSGPSPDRVRFYNLVEAYRALIYFEDDPDRTKILNELLEQVTKEHKQ